MKLAGSVLLRILQRCFLSCPLSPHLFAPASLGVGMGLHSLCHHQRDHFSELIELNIPSDSCSLLFRLLLSCSSSQCRIPHAKTRLIRSLLRPAWEKSCLFQVRNSKSLLWEPKVTSLVLFCFCFLLLLNFILNQTSAISWMWGSVESNLWQSLPQVQWTSEF